MKTKKANEMQSLNDKLLNEFSVEELEARLETDPLMLTTMFASSEASAEMLTCTKCDQGINCKSENYAG